MDKEIKQLNQLWTDIYYLLRYKHKENITHQSVRILQIIDKEDEVGIKDIAEGIKVSHNTASEHVKRLLEKDYVYKTRGEIDQRKVILMLTDLGKEVLLQNSSLNEEKLQQLLFEQMTEQERETILKAFNLMKERAQIVRDY
ncbi:MarR family transcriptional regulator [Bacillus sp. AFS001701]|uniref:MarR family winged helix-turn-helix transcriptional regulator n=1 Tax=Bacillus sp. AFS001701 TaxID=2033480 RepID=UPI000BF393B0|nr:MarR family transcriptional regulator [Bacillus sp. AFS001701]PET56742.1 MarR family transcriptional regulator [Bacillus sp. AFS001701]